MFKLKGMAILEIVEELQSLQDVYGHGSFNFKRTWFLSLAFFSKTACVSPGI